MNVSFCVCVDMNVLLYMLLMYVHVYVDMYVVAVYVLL